MLEIYCASASLTNYILGQMVSPLNDRKDDVILTFIFVEYGVQIMSRINCLMVILYDA